MGFLRFWGSFWVAFGSIWGAKSHSKINVDFGSFFFVRRERGAGWAGDGREMGGRSGLVKTATEPPGAAPFLSKKGIIQLPAIALDCFLLCLHWKQDCKHGI